MSLKLRGGDQVFVVIFGNKAITLDVVPDEDTIKNMKAKIREKEGIEIEDQILEFNGKILNNDKATLKQCGIKKEGYINLLDLEEYRFPVFVVDPKGHTI